MPKPYPIPEGITPLAENETRELLCEIIARAKTLLEQGILVFDLDSTLLDNRPRQALIVREYGEAHGVPELAANQADHWEGWDLRIAMRNAGLSEQAIETHYEPCRTFWRERFFTSEYCVHDVPIPGAPEFVRAGAEVGAKVFYVTGRWEGMRTGTLESFGGPEFPIPDGDRVRLVMKPTLDEHDDVFKDRTYAALRDAGAVVAAFDNEPTHINGYREAFPDAHSVHLATDHSLRGIKVREDIVSIRDFAPFKDNCG